MTTECENCKGGGLVGQGDSPWLLEGHKETCKQCSGTGKVAGESAAPEPEAPTETPATPAGEEKKEADVPAVDETVSAPVDTTIPPAVDETQTPPANPDEVIPPAVDETVDNSGAENATLPETVPQLG